MTAVMRDYACAARPGDTMIRQAYEVTRYDPAIETIRPPIKRRAQRITKRTKPTAREDRVIAQLWFSDVVERLLQYLSYGENWNGYGESAITGQAVARTVMLLMEVAMDGPEPAVVPMSDGGIQIEWYYGGTEIEIEVPSDDRELSVYITRPDGTVIEQPRTSLGDPIWHRLRKRIAAL